MIGSHQHFAARLLDWYDRSKRDLPWRVVLPSTGRPDPYHVLLSELMLQQTQVATVLPYFHRFLNQFPTVDALAAADEQAVLRLWQGLGYYSRARNLHRAAQEVARAGGMPSTVLELMQLPGVGRYTAGAIASIAFDQSAPILDGNVVRVLCRIDAVREDPRDRLVQQRLWARAEEILPAARVGDFNSALMELGATVCTPRSPKCLICPVAAHCQARDEQLVEQIPPVKRAVPTPLERRTIVAIRRGDRWLIEQRPSTGRWASMWQFVTRPTPKRLAELTLPVSIGTSRRIGQVRHQLTHRRYVFDVRLADVADGAGEDLNRFSAWVTLQELANYPLPKPHLAVAGLLAAL